MLSDQGNVVLARIPASSFHHLLALPPYLPPSSWRPDETYSTDGARIEAAFRKYFHRALPSQNGDSHELIVCHANVIRDGRKK